MKFRIKSIFLFLYLITVWVCTAQTKPHPEVNGTPKIYAPDLLDWPTDFPLKNPDLTEPTSNRIYDLHMQVNNCEAFDIILSTSGNYHMALTPFFYDHFIPKYKPNNWFYSTSPPIGVEQAIHQHLGYSNVSLNCMPHLVVGPKNIMDSLANVHLMEGRPIPLFTNKGNVMVVKKGNPKIIKGFWDLARKDIILATSNPLTEPGSFGNYAQSIYQIALQSKGEKEAHQLFTALFGKNTRRWVTGKRIHHREVPHLVYKGQADVGIVFYHLARYFVDTFPNEFEIIPLGGTITHPNPLPGNKIAKLFIAKVKANLSSGQQAVRDGFLNEIRNGALDSLLVRYHMNPIPKRK